MPRYTTSSLAGNKRRSNDDDDNSPSNKRAKSNDDAPMINTVSAGRTRSGQSYQPSIRPSTTRSGKQFRGAAQPRVPRPRRSNTSVVQAVAASQPIAPAPSSVKQERSVSPDQADEGMLEADAVQDDQIIDHSEAAPGIKQEAPSSVSESVNSEGAPASIFIKLERLTPDGPDEAMPDVIFQANQILEDAEVIPAIEQDVPHLPLEIADSEGAVDEGSIATSATNEYPAEVYEQFRERSIELSIATSPTYPTTHSETTTERFGRWYDEADPSEATPFAQAQVQRFREGLQSLEVEGDVGINVVQWMEDIELDRRRVEEERAEIAAQLAAHLALERQKAKEEKARLKLERRRAEKEAAEKAALEAARLDLERRTAKYTDPDYYKTREPLNHSWKPSPSWEFRNISQNLPRQRMAFLSYERDAITPATKVQYIIVGSTGNLYKVTIGPKLDCDCHIGQAKRRCKHLVHVLKNVLKVIPPLVWQKAFTLGELNDILRDPVSQYTQTDRLRESTKEGTCGICREPFGKDRKLVWCENECGKNVHRECMDPWILQKHEIWQLVYCPYCRAPWKMCGDYLDLLITKKQGGHHFYCGIHRNVAEELEMHDKRNPTEWGIENRSISNYNNTMAQVLRDRTERRIQDDIREMRIRHNYLGQLQNHIDMVVGTIEIRHGDILRGIPEHYGNPEDDRGLRVLVESEIDRIFSMAGVSDITREQAINYVIWETIVHRRERQQ